MKIPPGLNLWNRAGEYLIELGITHGGYLNTKLIVFKNQIGPNYFSTVKQGVTTLKVIMSLSKREPGRATKLCLAMIRIIPCQKFAVL
jgi:hypothetical protein